MMKPTLTDSTWKNTLQERLFELQELQSRTPTKPYSIALRLKLAKAYQNLGYPDLAASDAYKALLLVDEVAQEGEYHDEALEAARQDLTSGASVDLDDAVADSGDDEAIIRATKSWSKIAYDNLVTCLIDCGCLRSAFDHNSRALKAFPECVLFEAHQKTLTTRLRAHFESKGDDFDSVDIQDYPDKGIVRREQYPWNHYEPDRFSVESLQFLNDEMAIIAPKLEVKAAELPLLTPNTTDESTEVRYVKQLGVFAKEDIPPGEQILQEKSLLTAISRLHESYCDACSASLPNSRDTIAEADGTNTIISCEECEEIFYCSIECHDLAQESYHPSLCGATVEQKVPASEAADSLYSLLLGRALALAETQKLHPLELKELRYIWGDYHGLDLHSIWKVNSQGRLIDPFGSIPRTLPFSFNSNVLFPLHLLEKMDVNIFEQSHRYDTWIFNTLYAKFRGTASARQGLDGRPEIGAVHPMWCLANHSCDPNVAWEWQGSIKFWTREKLVDWKGGDPSRQPGIRKGEEVFSHYCDVRLPVKERREWAVGALGGECVCSRCVWEEAEEKRLEDGAI